MIKRTLCTLGLVVAATGSAIAAESFLDDRWYVSPVGEYTYNGDINVFAQRQWGAGLGIGKILDENFNVEVRPIWNHWQGSPVQGAAGKAAFGNYQADMFGGLVDLQYYFARGAFQPYAVVAAGAGTLGNGGNRDTLFLGEAGLGTNYEVNDNFLLRTDVRYRATLDTNSGSGSMYANNALSSNLNGVTVNVGFVVPFGDKPQPAKPAPVAAEASCASSDADGDGVDDCVDKCPGTIKGAKVDSDGCLVRIELRGVNFKYNSAELTEGAKQVLQGVAGDLSVFPEKRDIEVAGHTSTEGTNEYNMKLSVRRAHSVAEYLKAQGVTNNLYAKGYGEEYPLVKEHDEADRAKNRRVELIWMGD